MRSMMVGSTPVIADYQGNGKADFALFKPDGKGGMEYVYQTNQVGQGVTLDFALSLHEAA